MHDWFEQVRDLSITMVRWPSVTATAGETAFGRQLYDLLAELPYFRSHPEHLVLKRTDNDLCERYNVMALVKGSSPKTVVLSGHYDVVSIENYGSLAAWAYEPEALLPRLVADLRIPDPVADPLALSDLTSGKFLPGRGLLDMKSGLAAGLAVLMRWAEQEQPSGNLLFIASPDEEVSSHGMRSAVLQLPELAQRWNITLEAAINLDACDDQGDGSEGQAVFLGTVGKFLPCVYVVGCDTHAGSPFDGINANLLAAEVTRQIECNVDLVDVAEGSAAPPPVSLKQGDLKRHYDVTTPATAWCYFNVLTHGRSAADVLTLITEQVRSGLQAGIHYACTQSRRFEQMTGRSNAIVEGPPLILTYAELERRVAAHAAHIYEHAWPAFVRRTADDPSLDAPEVTRRMIEYLWNQSGLSGPAAVIGFGALHYPATFVGSDHPRFTRLREAVSRQTEALGSETGMAIRTRPFFPGISDMSFLGGAVSDPDQQVIATNTPAWGSRIRYDYAAASTLDLPSINIGPWGRDAHQATERVYMPYSFGVVPELIWRLVNDICSE